MQRGSTFAREFGSSLREGLVGIVGPAALATAALATAQQVAQSFVDAFNFKTELDATTNSINLQLKGVRDTGRVWAEAAQFANTYKLTQAETNAILASSTDILRVSNASIGELEANLLRLQSRDVSKPISEAARALRELQAGDTATIKELFNVSATEANRMKAEIEGGGDAVKVLGAYLDRAGVSMDTLKTRTEGTIGKMNDAAIAAEKLKIAQANWAEGPGVAILEGKVRLLTGATRALEGDWKSFGSSVVASVAEGQGGLLSFLNVLQPLAKFTQDLVSKNEIPAMMQQVAASSPAAAAAVQNLKLAYDLGGIGATEFVQALIAVQAQQQAGAAGSQASGNALLDEADRRAAATAATDKQNKSLIDQVAESQRAALQSQQLTQFQATLASIGGQVAAGHITAAEGAAQLGRMYTWARDRAAELINMQAQLAGAGSKNAGALLSQGAVLPNRALQERGSALASAFVGGVRASLPPSMFQTALSRPALPKVPGGRAGGGGGGKTRVKEAQKLNSELNDVETRAQQQREDAERSHVQKLLDIERDYHQKSLAQQRENETAKRSSRFSFYKSLSGAAKDLGQGEAQQYAAAYEAAFAESQQLAQQGQHKLAADLLQLRQRQIQEDIEAARAIAQAQKDNDAAEVARLQSLEVLRKDAQQAELEALKAAGDANVNARNEAIQDEQARYAQAQGQIERTSDRATERKIANAQKATQAIETENAALARQAQLHDRIAAPAGGPIPAPSASGPSAAPAPPTAAQAVTASAVADAALLSAVLAQTAMQAGKFDQVIGRIQAVESAIRSSGYGRAAN